MSAPDNIFSKLTSSFDNALSSAHLLFFPSTVHKHVAHGLEFQIRLCPSLAHKPVQPVASTKQADPFAPPYNPNLYLGELRDEETDQEYIVLLNKYSIVPHHFILASAGLGSQSSPLFPPDLVQTYRLLVAAHRARRHFIAFYNCGPNSGASQPHKHIQFLPVDEDDGPPIERLARSAVLEIPAKPFSLASLPYANHIFRFPSTLPSAPLPQLTHTLSGAFLSLLDLAISTIRHDPDSPPGKPSYNVLITLEHMHLIPRRLESPPSPTKEDASGAAHLPQLSVNALAFAGMLIAKSEKELEAIEREGVGKILSSVALKSVHELQVAETSLEALDDGQEC